MSSCRRWLQPSEERRGWQHAHARRGELDRERQPVERDADVGDRPRVGCGDDEVRTGDACARREERDRIAAEHLLEIVGGGRRPERLHGTHLLARQAERRPARHQEPHRGRHPLESGDRGRRGEEVLEVVENEEHVTAAQMPCECRLDGLARPVGDAECPRHANEHEVGVAQGREVDEEDTVAEVREELGRRLDGEPCLAGPTCPGQRHEPDVGPAQQLAELADLALPADERGRLRREVRRLAGERVERWELGLQPGRDDLEETLGGSQVVEAVLAEVAHVALVPGSTRGGGRGPPARRGSVRGARRRGCRLHRGSRARSSPLSSTSPRPRRCRSGGRADLLSPVRLRPRPQPRLGRGRTPRRRTFRPRRRRSRRAARPRLAREREPRARRPSRGT